MALQIASVEEKSVEFVFAHGEQSSSGRHSRFPSVFLDFDLLVSNIERSIMSDQENKSVHITPQELLVKSNPGIYLQEKDLTNPRELYNYVSHKTKSNEDLLTAVKRELVSKNDGLLPHLRKAISMKDIRSAAKTDFMRKDEIPFASMHKQNKNTKNLRAGNDIENDKEKFRNLVSFPSIKGYSDVGKDNFAYTTLHRDVSLPGLRKRHNVSRHEDFIDRKIYELEGTRNIPKTRESNGIVTRKLDKWFSEMPDEVLDKAQRALMEESVRDRLELYHSKRQAKAKTLHPKHIGGNNSRRVSNTCLQLSANSFENVCREDSNDKLSKYKLQQKSLHKLKMNEIDETERGENRYNDKFDSNTRSMTVPIKLISSTAKLDSRDKQRVVKTNVLSDVIGVSSDFQKETPGLKTVNINDVAFGAVRMQDEDSFQNGDTVETKYANSIHHSKLPNKNGSEEDTYDSKGHHSLEKNIMRINASELNARKENSLKQTIHATEILKNIKREKQSTIIIGSQLSEVQKENHASKWKYNSNNIENIQVANNKSRRGFIGERNENTKEDKMGKPMALIPTVDETYMGDKTSVSTTTRRLRQRSVLKKFNKLEVFSESQKTQMAISESYNKMFKQISDYHPSSSVTTNRYSGYKLDLKPYPQKHFPRYDSDMVRSEVRVQEVVFQFEPGEVIISKKSNAQNYEHRSSERARNIYGKLLLKEEMKDAKEEVNRDIKSIKSYKVLYSTSIEPHSQEQDKIEEKRRAERLLPSASKNTGKVNTLNLQDSDSNHDMERTTENIDKMKINRLSNIDESITAPTTDMQKQREMRERAVERDSITPEASVITPPGKDKVEKNGLDANYSFSKTLLNDITSEQILACNGLEEKELVEANDSEYAEIASFTDSTSIEIGFD